MEAACTRHASPQGIRAGLLTVNPTAWHVLGNPGRLPLRVPLPHQDAGDSHVPVLNECTACWQQRLLGATLPYMKRCVTITRELRIAQQIIS